MILPKENFTRFTNPWIATSERCHCFLFFEPVKWGFELWSDTVNFSVSNPWNKVSNYEVIPLTPRFRTRGMRLRTMTWYRWFLGLFGFEPVECGFELQGNTIVAWNSSYKWSLESMCYASRSVVFLLIWQLLKVLLLSK